MDVNRVWIPSKLSLLNYRIVVVSLDYFHNALRSLGLTLLVCVSQMASSTFVAYGLARFRNRLTNVLFAIAVFSMVIPPQLLMVPLVFNFRYFSFFGLFPEGLNLTGSILPFVLTSLTCMGLQERHLHLHHAAGVQGHPARPGGRGLRGTDPGTSTRSRASSCRRPPPDCSSCSCWPSSGSGAT